MSENKQTEIDPFDMADLYLVTATFTGDDENGKKLSLDIHSFIIIPKTVKDSEIDGVLKKNIPMDEGDKLQYRKVKVGESIQFLGYSDAPSSEDDEAKEGDVFTYKRCSLEFVQMFEKCKSNDDNGFLFKPNELGVFPPPANPFFESIEQPKEEPKTP